MESRVSFYACDKCAEHFLPEEDETFYWVSCKEADNDFCDICEKNIYEDGGYIVSKKIESVLKMILKDFMKRR